MKRSEINQILTEGDAFIRSFGTVLPPFANWSPEELKTRFETDTPSLLDARLGWDITDFGSGNFADCGLFLFSARNGSSADLAKGRGMLYAEKIMIVRQNQITPLHRHVIKAEDIINRGGGNLVLTMFNSLADGSPDEHGEVQVATDARLRTLKAGSHLSLAPGESVTLLPGNWHSFWGEGSDVLVGEVSTVNDDLTDNVFHQPVGRFSTIDEDEKPHRLLVSDYDTWLR